MSDSVSDSDSVSATAVLGGTFDPVHRGHLSLAVDLSEKLNVKKVSLLPSFQPLLKDSPQASNEQRLKMLQLAVSEYPQLTIDRRELTREGASYTLLSLQEIRAEIAEKPLYFILGQDAFCQLDQWYQWQSLLDYAHLVVALRPGSQPNYSQSLSEFVDKFTFKGEGFPKTSAGSIIFINNALYDISSSNIRKKISEQESIKDLLPKAVDNYIEQQMIYR